MMDWGLILVILAIVFLVGHLALDGYRLFRHVRRLRHVKYEALNGWNCDRCLTAEEGLADMRHEAIWTVAAIVALGGHIITDFMRW